MGNYRPFPFSFPLPPWQCSLLFSLLICFLSLVVLCMNNPMMHPMKHRQATLRFLPPVLDATARSLIISHCFLYIPSLQKTPEPQHLAEVVIFSITVQLYSLLLAVHPWVSQKTHHPFVFARVFSWSISKISLCCFIKLGELCRTVK